MKFAIISDIHGNQPALDAVLEDAEKSGVDSQRPFSVPTWEQAFAAWEKK